MDAKGAQPALKKLEGSLDGYHYTVYTPVWVVPALLYQGFEHTVQEGRPDPGPKLTKEKNPTPSMLQRLASTTLVESKLWTLSNYSR